MIAMPLGGGTVAVAVNVVLSATLPVVTDATSVFGPLAVGIVQLAVASPFASVVAVVGDADPLPEDGVNVTVTPATGCSPAPVTRTRTGAGNALPAIAC